MLTQEDLQNIGGLIDKKFDYLTFVLNQGFSNVQKQLKHIDQRIDKLNDGIERFLLLHLP